MGIRDRLLDRAIASRRPEGGNRRCSNERRVGGTARLSQGLLASCCPADNLLARAAAHPTHPTISPPRIANDANKRRQAQPCTSTR